MRKVCVVIGSRANYSSIKSAMRAIEDHPELELQVIVGASALLDRYGAVVDLIEKDGFRPAARTYMLIEGETPVTMAKSTGVGLMELPSLFESLKPDIILTVGDRFETMATTLAAVYTNLPVAHTMGGEVTGTIDESIRHAVTKFAHIHFPASTDARDRIIRLGERPDDIYMVGCPRIDLVAETLEKERSNRLQEIFTDGVGEEIDLANPFVLVSQHPVTTEYGDGEQQITTTMEAVAEVGLPAIVLWPNADAGSEDIARGLRKCREKGRARNMHFFKNLPVETYVRLMARTACLVGNSSSGVREGAFIGTPVVNIGTRQQNRQRGRNVQDVTYSLAEIVRAMEAQISHGPFPMDPIYGNGKAGEKIAEVLATCEWKIQKCITY